MQGQELIKRMRESGATGSDEAIAAYLTDLGITKVDSAKDIKELANDFNQQGKGVAIAPVAKGLPSTQRTMTKRGGKRSARDAVADTIASRDTAVSEILDEAATIAQQKTSARKKQIAQELGDRMANAEMQAIEEVADFLQMTLGSSQWLLQGAEEILEAQILG